MLVSSFNNGKDQTQLRVLLSISTTAANATTSTATTATTANATI